MRRVVRFYDNIQPANKKSGYTFDNIVNKWTDYQLQVRKGYIEYLFPLPNDVNTKLSKGLLYKMKKNKNQREKVSTAVLRLMNLYGYTLVMENDSVVVKQVHKLYRESGRTKVGLFNESNYPHITRMLKFLELVNMKYLSSLVFLMLIKAMDKNQDLKKLICSKNVLEDWISTQDYLLDKKYSIIENMCNVKLDDWEKDDNDSDNVKLWETEQMGAFEDDSWKEDAWFGFDELE